MIIVEFVKNISKMEACRIVYGTSSHDFYLKANFKNLKNLFGMYGKGDQCKVKAEWTLIFFVSTTEHAKGKIVPITLSDYKEYDKNLNEVSEWHIGNFECDNEEVALIVNWINRNIPKSIEESK